MRSVQSLVISASMKQIVPLIAVKMWCWNPLRFSYEGSSHLHGFILRYSQAVHTWWEIIIKENSFAFNSVFCLIWSWEREKREKENQDAIVFSWTVNCSKAGNEMFDLFLCVLKKCSIDTRRGNMNMVDRI